MDRFSLEQVLAKFVKKDLLKTIAIFVFHLLVHNAAIITYSTMQLMQQLKELQLILLVLTYQTEFHFKYTYFTTNSIKDALNVQILSYQLQFLPLILIILIILIFVLKMK